MTASTASPEDAALAAWSTRATDLVRRRLRDARAHAEAGRMSDAAERLDELNSALVRGVIRPARGEFYLDAHTTALSELDPRVVDPEARPSTEGAEAAKSARIGGRDQSREVKAAVDSARLGLTLAFARPTDDPSVRDAFMRNWERRHSEAIAGTTRTLLSDAQIALREAIGKIVIRPEFR
jgi:hypothetical protein